MTFAFYTNLRLVIRSLLFCWGLVTYLADSQRIDAILSGTLHETSLFLCVAWAVMLASILFRLFPSKSESLGAEKEHADRYRPRRTFSRDALRQAIRRGNRDALRSLALWVAVNGVLFLLYFQKVFSVGVLLLVSLFYSIMDLVCIKFYCPFQRWLMKNRCCTTCRIYNWDHIMIHTPTLLIPNPLSIPLWLGSAVLAIRWEWNWLRHPERFLEAANQALSCSSCPHPESCQSCVRKRIRSK